MFDIYQRLSELKVKDVESLNELDHNPALLTVDSSMSAGFLGKTSHFEAMK